MIIDVLVSDKSNISVSCQNLLTKQMLDMSMSKPNVSATPANMYLPIVVDLTFPNSYTAVIDNDLSLPDGAYVLRYHSNNQTFEAVVFFVMNGNNEYASKIQSYKFSVR